MAVKDRIVLIGGSGLVGQAVRETLRDQFRFVDLSFPDFDIRNPHLVEAKLRQYRSSLGVINLAAATDTSRASTDLAYAETCWDINAAGAGTVASVCANLDLRLVHVSTDYVYSGNKTTPYVETDVLDPIEPYGKSKAVGEYRALHFNARVATLAFPYTPHSSRPDVVAKLVSRLQAGDPIKAFQDQLVCPTYLPDFALGLTRLLTNPQLEGKYHLVGPVETPYDIARTVATRLNLNPDTVIPTSVSAYNLAAAAEGRRTFQPNLGLSAAKFELATGIQFRYFRECVEEYLTP